MVLGIKHPLKNAVRILLAKQMNFVVVTAWAGLHQDFGSGEGGKAHRHCAPRSVHAKLGGPGHAPPTGKSWIFGSPSLLSFIKICQIPGGRNTPPPLNAALLSIHEFTALQLAA